MSDIARTLLVEYYGFGEKSKDKNFLSIHECIDDAQNLPHKSIVENSSLDAKENSTSTEKKSEEEYTASDEIDSPIQQHKTSFRILDVEVFDVSDENVTNLNAIDKIDTEYNVLEYLQSASTKKLTSDNNPPNVGKTMLEIPGGEEVDRSEANHSYIEEALDSVSEISSISTKKKSQKSAKAKIAVSSVVPKREPICNETFADYSKVELTEFPREIPETFPNLRMLYLANNNLTELPDELFHNLQSLEWLDVRNNQLTSLPSAIKSHNSLETLLLQENRLQTLPLELCTLPRLKILHVAHNPLLMPPKDITALGPPGILNFLRLEWNKMHPDEEILPREPKIEPKLSTILCYQSPRKDDKKTTRSTHPKALFDDPSKKLCSREKGKLYKPSSRYNDAKDDNFPPIGDKQCENPDKKDSAISLCFSCARNSNDFSCESEATKNGGNPEKSLLEMICNRRKGTANIYWSREGATFDDVTKRIDNNILRLSGPSPRSLYVRKNVAALRNYENNRTRECRVKFPEIPLSKMISTKKAKISAKEETEADEATEKTCEIITGDGRIMKLRPMRLEDSDWIMSYLENYVGLRSN